MQTISTQMKKLSVLILAATVLAGCGGEPDKKEELAALKKEYATLASEIKKLENEIAASGDTVAAEAKGKMVAVTTLKLSAFRHFVEVQGSIDAEENIAVSPQMPGVVTRIHVKAGEMVRKGQVLAEMNNGAIVQQIDGVKAQVEMARTAFEKQKALWDRKIGSEMQYLQAKTQKESAEKQLSALMEQGDLSKIESPIDGVVDAVIAKVGQAAAPGFAAFQVVNLSSLTVKGKVPEKYAAKVKTGTEVVLYFPDLNKEVDTKASYSAKVIDPMSRTFTVEVKLEGSTVDYHPNMITVLKVVDYKKDSAVVVPTDVVQQGESGSFVFVAQKEKTGIVVKKKVVEAGESYNGSTEILKGLTAGDVIITKGYQNVNDGDAIQY